jgi:NAD(P)-dependent dehydrogenase (short-subunit alcohol dehydrogenase family)
LPTLWAQIALGHFGEPVEVAHTIRFLASPAADYVTGATLAVDGGLVMA